MNQTHDINVAESLSPITKRLNKVNESTQKLGDVIRDSNSEKLEKALTNSSKFSISMRQMIGSLLNSENSLKTTQDGESGRAKILGKPIQISGADTIKIYENIYELTPEIYKALSDTGYTGKTMKKENDILMMINIKGDLGYTGDVDKPSKRKSFLTKTLPKLVEKIQNKTFEEKNRRFR